MESDKKAVVGQTGGAGISSTNPARHSLTKATGRGGVYQVLAGGWESAVRLAASAVLARLLTPDSFGLVAMSMIVCELFGQAGTLSSTTGIIAKTESNEKDLSTAFWLGMIVYGCLFTVINVSAPFLASLLCERRLSSTIHVASLVLLVKGVSAVPSALLHKRLFFGSMALISGSSVVLEMVMAVSLVAFAGMTYWALIWSMVVSNVFVSAALVIAARWRPGCFFSKESFNYLLPYGLNGVGVNVCMYVAQNVDRFLIGRLMGVNALGLYSFSYRLPDLVLRRLAMPAGGTVLPALSNLGGESVRIVAGYARVAKYTALLTFPMLAGLGVLAQPIVFSLWGENWLACISALQILCLPAMISCIGSSSGAVFLCMNRPDILTWLGAFRLVVTVILVLCGYPWGIVGVSTGMAISAGLSYAATLYCLRRVTGESPLLVLQAVWPPLACSIACGVLAYIAWATMAQFKLPAFFILIIAIVTGIGAYFASLRLFFRDCWVDAVETFRIIIQGMNPHV